jgi:hypothetical protein
MTAAPLVPAPIAAWHELVALGHEDRASAHERLDALLAEDVVFRSPAVHTPQEGKEVTTAYLRAALVVLGPGLTYHREWYAADSAVLEFTTDVGGRQVHGVDMITWGRDGRITDFTVLVRPAQGLEALIGAMAAELSAGR